MSDSPKTLQDVMTELDLTVHAEFVPWSRSRDYQAGAGPDKRSLNWRVTLRRHGRDVLTTDYSAGIGHCPSYRPSARWTLDYAAAIEHETENGRVAYAPGALRPTAGKPILPDPTDIVASLAMDSDVLDHGTFESWAADAGYDTDSRKAEATYRACLELALRLRAALGDADLTALRDAASWY